MIQWLLVRRLRRIRLRRFVFVRLSYSEAFGSGGWSVAGDHLHDGVVPLSGDPSLRAALRKAAETADRLYDDVGERREVAA